jgi:hypothetical protein
MGESQTVIDQRACSYLTFLTLRVGRSTPAYGGTDRRVERRVEKQTVFWLVVYRAVRIVSFTGHR